MPQDQAGASRREARDGFVTRVAIVAGAAALVFLAWQVRHALILAFGGVVAAVILTAMAHPLRHWAGIGRGWAVTASVLIIVGVLALFGWIVYPEAKAQISDLIARLPDSLEELDRMMGSWLPEDAMRRGGMMAGLAQRLALWSGMVVTGVTTLVLVIAAGVFFALRPTAYRNGLVSLFPPSQQPRLREALNRAATALAAWLRAQLLSMLVIGTAVAVATWLLGLPSPLALGLIAGLLEFVPIIGPIVAAIPALLLALAIGPTMVLWTGLAYFAIEQLESNVILPLAQREVADLPPALLIFAFVAMSAVFGIAGVIVSAPFTIALYSLVNDLYVKPLNENGASG